MIIMEISPAITGIATTLGTAALLFAVGWVWRMLRQQITTGHDENRSQLAQILSQVTKTNGTVARHTEEIAALTTHMGIVEAKQELLTEIYLGRQAP